MASAERLLELYRTRGLRIATAESCTGGMIAAALTDVAGSSDVFERGFVTYSNEAKQELVAVPPAILTRHGAVSAETAEAMARGALARSRADVAISVTGVAGPGGGSTEKPVGLVWFGVARKGAAVCTECRLFSGDRATIRRAAVERALELLAGAVAVPTMSVSVATYLGKRVVGIDFSGAQNAGKLIWIAEGTIGDMGQFVLKSCKTALDRLGCSKERTVVLAALADWIAQQGPVVIGCDFPFSLPFQLISQTSWHAFARAFQAHYPNARAFQKACHSVANHKEHKRIADRVAKTPMSPYNERLFHQTYAGIAHVLAPLIGRAAIAPFDEVDPDKPLIVETCPASSLKALGIEHRQYKQSKKDKAAECRQGRIRIVESLIARRLVLVPGALRERIIADKGGDALDSVIAALGAIAALPQMARRVGYDQPVEGWVYYVTPDGVMSSQP